MTLANNAASDNQGSFERFNLDVFQGLVCLFASFNITVPWPIGLLIFGLLLILAYLAVIDLVSDSDRRPTLAEAAASSALGLACLGFVLLFLRWLSLSFLAIVVFLVAATLANAYRRRRLLLPKLDVLSGLSIVSIAVIAAFALPLTIGGLLMATGEYPGVFFNADTPYRLTHTHEFLEDRGLPPLSLSNLGIRVGYHYAAPAAAASVALITGLPAHASFILTIVIALIGIFAVTALLADLVRGQIPFVLVFSLLLIAGPQLGLSFAKATREWFSDPQLFYNHFPDVTVYFGTFLFLIALLASLDLRNARRGLLAVLAVALLAATKSGYLPTAGLVLLSGAVLRLYRSRDPRWLLLPAGAFVASLAVATMTGTSTTVQLDFDPFFLFEYFPKKAAKYGLDLLLFVLPAVGYAWLAGTSTSASRAHKDRLLIIGFAIVCLLGYLNMFGGFTVRSDGTREPYGNLVDPLNITAKLLFVAAVLLLAAYWNPGRRKLNLAINLYLALVVVLPLSHRTMHALKMYFQPESGHEYVDNRAIAEALSRIPVPKSVIVTNDLRYPANGYKRDQRQMQIPANFGHQAYAANTVYEVYPDVGQRLAWQSLLAKATWDPAIVEIARDQGWTHLLIHKDAPHPSRIPLIKLFDGRSYSVYAFE